MDVHLMGNFGQTNYGAAKMALVGLMQTLSLEGERHGIRVTAGRDGRAGVGIGFVDAAAHLCLHCAHRNKET